MDLHINQHYTLVPTYTNLRMRTKYHELSVMHYYENNPIALIRGPNHRYI